MSDDLAKPQSEPATFSFVDVTNEPGEPFIVLERDGRRACYGSSDVVGNVWSWGHGTEVKTSMMRICQSGEVWAEVGLDGRVTKLDIDRAHEVAASTEDVACRATAALIVEAYERGRAARP